MGDEDCPGTPSTLRTGRSGVRGRASSPSRRRRGSSTPRGGPSGSSTSAAATAGTPSTSRRASTSGSSASTSPRRPSTSPGRTRSTPSPSRRSSRSWTSATYTASSTPSSSQTSTTSSTPQGRRDLAAHTARLLAPGGKLFLNAISVHDKEHYGVGAPVPGEENTWVDGKYIHLSTEEEVRRDFSALSIEELYEHEYEEPHPGARTHNHIAWILVAKKSG